MGELGFLGIRYPSEYGGSELDTLGSVVLAEELGCSTFGGGSTGSGGSTPVAVMMSRRGHVKSSARPAGASIASPFTSTRVATESGMVARTGVAPSSVSLVPRGVVNDITGLALGRGGRPGAAEAGGAFASGSGSSCGAGVATGVRRACITRRTSRST